MSIGRLQTEADLKRFGDQHWAARGAPAARKSGGGGDPTPSGDKHYAHTQSSPSALWVVVHNLGKRPSVTVVDSGGSVWACDVQHLSENQCVITFSAPFAGKAYCN